MNNKIHEYVVTGVGQFPEDMLRYDQARIVGTLGREGHKWPFYYIEGKVPPTVGRWQSFLWTVIQTPEERARWGL